MPVLETLSAQIDEPSLSAQMNFVYNIQQAEVIAFDNAITCDLPGVVARALDTLVGSLKTAGVWTKLQLVYPFVGELASCHAVNLKSAGTFDITWVNEQDSDFSTAEGVQGNRVAQTYGKTGWIYDNHVTDKKHYMGYYSRTAESNLSWREFQASGGGNGLHGMIIGFSTTEDNIVYSGTQTNTNIGAGNYEGYFSFTRRSSTDLEIYKNGVSINTSSVLDNSTGTNQELYFHEWNSGGSPNGNYSGRTCGFFMVGNDEFSDAEELATYNAIQTFQTTLNRQV